MAESNNSKSNKITLKIFIPEDQTVKMTIVPVDVNMNKLDCLELKIGSDNTEGHLMGTIDKVEYTVSIKDISFTKKMYSPNEMKAELHIKNVSKDSDVLPDNKQLQNLFLKRKVEAICDDNNDNPLFSDYYVQKIEPTFLAEDLYVTLTICSPDYQMTIDENCHSFVAQKLSEVMDGQKDSFVLPYNTNTKVDIDHSQMKHVVVDKQEHIFPYLVQYNESYYDFLKRITNRWGEFLYYEDGKLHAGYNSKGDATKVDNYYRRSYGAIDAKAAKTSGDGTHAQATQDTNTLETILKKGKYNTVKAKINSFDDKDLNPDKYIMSKIASLLNSKGSFGAWAINTVVDDLIDLASSTYISDDMNNKFDESYFNSQKINDEKEHYNGDGSKYNEFTEFKSILSSTDYLNILHSELTAGCDTVKLEFLTTYPNLKLGQMIEVAGEKYLVVELKGYTRTRIDVDEKGKEIDVTMIYYEATGVAFTATGAYPSYLESGHIRKSGIQHATVVDNDDPARSNRVKVQFDWQGEKDSTPWLLFAQGSATNKAGIQGRHYKKEEVLVGFINGNVERPYVIGAVHAKTPTPLLTGSAAVMSPAGHGLRVSDGRGAGLTAFLGSITPGLKAIQALFPGWDMLDFCDKTQYFEGDTEIADYYGIYSIKGSTDKRNITIKSPWGDVKINAFTGITVAAPNGDIKLQGKNVTIEAGNNLKLVSGTNIKNKFFSRAGSEDGENMLSMMDDAAIIVAQKLQTLAMNVFDLKVVRNMFDVVWKPQEGLLEVQSNRFLKLEAGGAKAGYPAYNDSYRSKKQMENALKDGAKTMLKMGPAIAGLLYKIDPWVNDLINNYKELYNQCISRRMVFESAVQMLSIYANDRNNANAEPICHGYGDLEALLWNKGTKEIKEADLDFNPNRYCIEDNAIIDQDLDDTLGHAFVIKKRKESKADVVKKANALLKSIQNLRQVKVSNHKTIWEVGYFYGTFTWNVPKNYLDAFKKAVALDSLKGTYYYQMLKEEPSEEFKALTAAHLDVLNNHNHKLALKRKIAVNLLNGWGIQEFNEPPVPAQLGEDQLPPAPTSIPSNEEQLLDPTVWDPYVSRLTVKNIPAMERDLQMVGTLASNFVDNINIVRPALEYYSWGKAKKGKILFSDDQTYQLGQKIQAVATKYNKGRYNKAELGDDVDQKINNFIRPIREGLANLGAVAPPENQLHIEGLDQIEANENEDE